MFFKKRPKRINLDKCPVCKLKWGFFNALIMRTHRCDDCKANVTFFPANQNKKPIMEQDKHKPKKCNCGNCSN